MTQLGPYWGIPRWASNVGPNDTFVRCWEEFDIYFRPVATSEYYARLIIVAPATHGTVRQLSFNIVRPNAHSDWLLDVLVEWSLRTREDRRMGEVEAHGLAIRAMTAYNETLTPAPDENYTGDALQRLDTVRNA